MNAVSTEHLDPTHVIIDDLRIDQIDVRNRSDGDTVFACERQEASICTFRSYFHVAREAIIEATGHTPFLHEYCLSNLAVTNGLTSLASAQES